MMCSFAHFETAVTHYSKGGAIYAKGNVTLTNSVVENSYVSGAVGALGGGTYALGNVYMTNSIVSGNSAIATAGNLQASGGGIYARKGLIATYSSISNNYASSNGGGIFLRGGGKVYIQYSTISGNRVDSGSGSGLDVDLLYEDIVNIQNSTISGNSGVGAALNTLTYTTISNSTIAFNKATSAFNVPAGLFSLESITMQSTIFANNIGASGGEYDVQSLVGLTGANNLIGATHNTVPPGTLNSCPLLGPLASNGGPTQTHALLLGSPAINAGNNISSLKGDQRGAGFIRVVGAKADIGAYELQSGVTPDRIFASQFEGRCD
jgi:Right handed beta helix region